MYLHYQTESKRKSGLLKREIPDQLRLSFAIQSCLPSCVYICITSVIVNEEGSFAERKEEVYTFQQLDEYLIHKD